jgi:hypothetical protein
MCLARSLGQNHTRGERDPFILPSCLLLLARGRRGKATGTKVQDSTSPHALNIGLVSHIFSQSAGPTDQRFVGANYCRYIQESCDRGEPAANQSSLLRPAATCCNSLHNVDRT